MLDYFYRHISSSVAYGEFAGSDVEGFNLIVYYTIVLFSDPGRRGEIYYISIHNMDEVQTCCGRNLVSSLSTQVC